MKRLVTRGLGILARQVVKKYRPTVVAITGSVGKTTTRSACVSVLSARFRVRGSAKNYNNELGVPLTVFDMEAPGRNIASWVALYWKGILQLLVNDPLFPQVLVVEMGADHPGDIAYLMSIAPPDVSVVTAVSAAHTEFMGSVEGVLREKKTLMTGIGADKIAIYNGDDEYLPSVVEAGEIRARTLSYGFVSGASVRGKEVTVTYDESGNPSGMEAQVIIDGSQQTIRIPRVLGRPAVYAALAGSAVGYALGMSVHEIEQGLSTFEAPAGRMRIIEGIKGVTLIDDTYNSSPKAAHEALAIVSTMPGRRIAVMGDMLELGSITEAAHREVGNAIALAGFDMLVTVGPLSKFIATQARESGMDEQAVFSFDTAEEAGVFLQDRIRDEDIILVKGSQGVRCEKIVKELMADPLRAEELLVRQSKAWVE